MKRHSWLTRLGVFTLAFLMPVLAACGGAAATATAPPAKEVKIGVVLSLTGDNQIYGNPQKNAIQLAIDEINAAGGVPAGKLDPGDRGRRRDEGQGHHRLREADQDRQRASRSSARPSATPRLATDPVAQQAGVPVLGVSNTANGIVEIGDFIFRDSLAEAQVIPATIKAAKDKLGLKKVAIMYGDRQCLHQVGLRRLQEGAATTTASRSRRRRPTARTTPTTRRN